MIFVTRLVKSFGNETVRPPDCLRVDGVGSLGWAHAVGFVGVLWGFVDC